jgi:dTDP-4-dehydrorhamnose reductase
MSINKLIILGANGMLGNYIKRYFQEYSSLKVICINRQSFDAFNDDIYKLETILKEHLNINTLVFNAIGVIPQSSKNYEIMNQHFIKINKEFPHNLSALCNKYNAKLIHPSTDCVYTGHSQGSYNENNSHDEMGIYGKTKSLGEPKNCTVIRTSIIGEEVYNYRSLVEWVKKNKNEEINGYVNHYWNGVTCLQYAKIIEHMINNNIFWKGVRHICSPRIVSKYELCEMINNVYELNIKINKYETDGVDKSLSTIYEENNLFNIPDLSKQIIEMRDFSNTLYNNGIPKVFYSYWSGSPLSYLQYLTIVTFQELNPKWKIVIYIPTEPYLHKTWKTPEQKSTYTGKDYLEELYKLNIEIRKIDFVTIGFNNEIPEVIKSDYLRYWILGYYGGLWSDMDIIYIKPIEQIFNKNLQILGNFNNIDTVICYFDEHYPIGLLMSKPNNQFFIELQNNAIKYLDIDRYQCIGAPLMKHLFAEPYNIKEKYPNLNILIMTNQCYLPYAWNKINDIFVHNLPNNFTQNTVGIHWFNGSAVSMTYVNMIDTNDFPTNNSIYPYIQKYLNKL